MVKNSLAFEAETFRKIQPQEYLRRFIQGNIRPDGRSLSQFRPTTVNQSCITTTNGSSMVRIGNTTVVCGIKAEVATPKFNSPLEGYLVPNIDLSPICSPKFKPGPPGELAQVLSENLNNLLKSASVLDLTSLCIKEGIAVWVLYIDLVCVNYDGNIYDASVIGMITALTNVKLPEATFEESSGLVKATEELSVTLKLQRIPYSVTVALFDGQHLLVDPTEVEESITSEQITIVFDEVGQLCSIWKVGGLPSSPEHLKQCMNIARERYKQISMIVKSSI